MPHIEIFDVKIVYAINPKYVINILNIPHFRKKNSAKYFPSLSA